MLALTNITIPSAVSAATEKNNVTAILLIPFENGDVSCRISRQVLECASPLALFLLACVTISILPVARIQSARGLAHSKTWRQFECRHGKQPLITDCSSRPRWERSRDSTRLWTGFSASDRL